MFSLT